MLFKNKDEAISHITNLRKRTIDFQIEQCRNIRILAEKMSQNPNVQAMLKGAYETLKDNNFPDIRVDDQWFNFYNYNNNANVDILFKYNDYNLKSLDKNEEYLALIKLLNDIIIKNSGVNYNICFPLEMNGVPYVSKSLGYEYPYADCDLLAKTLKLRGENWLSDLQRVLCDDVVINHSQPHWTDKDKEFVARYYVRSLFKKTENHDAYVLNYPEFMSMNTTLNFFKLLNPDNEEKLTDWA